MQLASHKNLAHLNGRSFLALICSLILCQLGCGAPQDASSRAVSEAPLRFLGRMLIGYAHSHGGSYPKSNDDLVRYLEANKSRWAADGSADAKALLTSPFDGQPLVIVPNSEIGPTGPSTYRIVAFESQGINNIRRAINERGGVLELESQELEKLFPSLSE